MWSADKRAKYGTPERKLSQMQAYVRYFQEYHSPNLQPHIFYIDARWSSLALMDHIATSRCYGVLSCSAGMRPKALIPWMKNGLNKGDWWSIGYTHANANLITIRTKKKVYLNLLTNYASLASVTMRKQRRKYPREQYNVRAPFVQKNYNEYKCGVDKWNRALLEYYRSGFFINSDVMYSTFFHPCIYTPIVDLLEGRHEYRLLSAFVSQETGAAAVRVLVSRATRAGVGAALACVHGTTHQSLSVSTLQKPLQYQVCCL